MTSTANDAINPAEVRRVAALARLHIGDAEMAAAVADMQRIVHHVDMLASLDVDDVPVSAHGVNLQGVVREDVVEPGLPIDLALANAPERLGDGFGVPKIIE